MGNTSSEKSETIRFLDFKAEMEMRMEHYSGYPDLIALFLKSYRKNKQDFDNAANHLGLDLFDEKGDFKNLQEISLNQIEDIARKMDRCGYDFLESGFEGQDHRFFKYLPLRYQPYIDELYEFAFHREFEKLQYYIEDFVKAAHLDIDELNAIDFANIEVTISTAEKIAQGLYIPAFALIEHEYIIYTSSKIQEFNPHRSFHRLRGLSLSDKNKILEYVQYIAQGDGMITSGEMQFFDKLVKKLGVEKNAHEYKKRLFEETKSFNDLKPLSSSLIDSLRRQILGLVIDCAYADQVLNKGEGPRILEIAQLIIGNSDNAEDE